MRGKLDAALGGEAVEIGLGLGETLYADIDFTGAQVGNPLGMSKERARKRGL